MSEQRITDERLASMEARCASIREGGPGLMDFGIDAADELPQVIADLRASRAEMEEYRTKVSAMIDEIRAAAARADAAWEAEVAKLKRELAIADEELRQVVRERDEVAESAGKRRRR